MKTFFGIFQASSWLLTASALASGPVTFNLMHTVQNCQHEGHQKTWCDLNDVADSVKASGLESEIVAQLDRALAHPDKARVFASEFSFSDKAIQDKMCQLGKAGVAVSVYLDYGSSADIQFTSNPECQKDPANPNLKGVLLGGFTDFPSWRLHHNKTVIVDAGDGSPFNIDFSSGNLSKFGTSLHMDHWVMMKAPGDSNIARASLCLFQGLNAADAKATQTGMYAGAPDFSKDPAVMAAYQSTRDQCYKANGVIPMDQPEKAIAKEGVAAFFTPNAGRQALQTLKREMKSVDAQAKKGPAYLYIAIEHFSTQALADILTQAADHGVDVRIIMNSGTVNGGSEVTSDGPFYESNFKNSRVQVRFIETNGDSRQQMHNKFAILNGKRVFSGAGHYTSSGLDGNFESLYLTQDDELTRKYGQYFKLLWDESVDENYLTQHTPVQPGASLSPQFLKMIQ